MYFVTGGVGRVGRRHGGGRAADQRLADLLEDQRVVPEHVAEHALGVDAALLLLVLLDERDQARAADADVQAVDVVRDLRDVGRVVLLAQRRPDALGDLAADRAELGHEAGQRRVRERVVVTDDRGGLPAEVVVGVVAETGRPLRAVRVEPEEVRRLHLQRRVLRAGDAVDERLVRVLLRVVRDRDALVAGERADHDVGVLLLHQAARLLDRLVGRVVGAAVTDDLDVLAGDLGTLDAVARRLAGGLAARVADQRQMRARDGRLEERAERTLAVGQEADLDRAALLLSRGVRRPRPPPSSLVVAAPDADERQRRQGGEQRQQLASPQNTSPLNAHQLTVPGAGPVSGPAVVVVVGSCHLLVSALQGGRGRPPRCRRGRRERRGR